MNESERVRRLRKLHMSYLDRYTKAVGQRNEIIQICEDYKAGTIGDMNDSFLVDCILDVLKGASVDD